jgi:hypothetical protein
VRRPSGPRYRQRSCKRPLLPSIPQDRTPSPEVIHNTAPEIAKRVALLRLPQDLHTTLGHPAKLPPVTRLLLTPGLTARTAWFLALNIHIRVVVGGLPSMPGATKLPNNTNDPLKEIRPERLSTWLPQCPTSRSAEMSMVMVTCQLRHQAPNRSLHRRSRSRHHHLITPLHYR